MKIIKKFSGYSGSSVFLFKKNNKFLVQKKTIKSSDINNLYQNLRDKFYLPEILDTGNDHITMEYINGIEMSLYLNSYDEKKIFHFSKFINHYFNTIKIKSYKYDYSKEIKLKLNDLSKTMMLNELKFNLDELYLKIPKILSKSFIHGDFTFDNILYKNKNFYLIDLSPTDLDAIEFDYNKLMQDINSLWFVRGSTNKLDYKIICKQILDNVDENINSMYNRYINIFMLLRILPYSKNFPIDNNFLINEINKLWR